MATDAFLAHVRSVLTTDAFVESEHPRAPQGKATGGQFVKKGQGVAGGAGEKMKKRPPHEVRQLLNQLATGSSLETFKADIPALIRAGENYSGEALRRKISSIGYNPDDVIHAFEEPATKELTPIPEKSEGAEIREKLEALATGSGVTEFRGDISKIVELAEAYPEELAKHLESELGYRKKDAKEIVTAISAAVPAANASKVEKSLSSGKLKSSHRLGGGHANSAFRVTLSDGRVAVWKPRDGELADLRKGGNGLNTVPNGTQATREAASWEVAKLVGMQDMATPAVIRKLQLPDDSQEREGALLDWQPGEEAARVLGEARWDGAGNLARAAVFDYVIGNTDRHAGNWLVAHADDPKKAQLKLIDHGLAFPVKPFDWMAANARILQQAAYGNYEPKEFAEPYLKNKAKILSALSKVGIERVAIAGVEARIDSLKNATRWGSGFDGLKVI